MDRFDLSRLVRPNVAKLKPYSSARDEFKTQGEEMVFLDANENPFENGMNRYPDPQQLELKSKLAEIRNVPSHNILLGNGSDEVLDLLFRAFCEPGTSNIISLPPTYGMYKVLADINNVENREVLLNHDFEPDVTAILNQVDANSRMIFLCSPNNPSGNSFDPKKVEKLLQEFNGLVVVDEAYIDFSEQQSWLDRLAEFPNLIITQTFSKAFGKAGIRLGILFATNDIVQILNKIKPPYNINSLTQKEALSTLKGLDKIKSQIADIVEERNALVKVLLEVHFIKKIFKSDANFLLIEVDDANLRYDQLLKKGIVVRNRSSQPLCENCLRITIGTKNENDLLINIIKELDQ
ncbi:histidinol-phosphate transaminase [Christiangramia aquimixticola]|uniref:histidinol-phosphate transaminase n=1 Tax=Christiangramia aquimixticola TaxID=1697558 RepID=UPI003AA851A4